MGMLQNYQVDLSITPMRFLVERIAVSDFTVVTWITEYFDTKEKFDRISRKI